jgi:adenylyl-sulfate kinase
MIIQLTGLSGAGKTTIAALVRPLLERHGLQVTIIDGDEYRKTLCRDLGFSKEDRQENIRRLGKLAYSFSQQQHVAIIAAINPYESIRQELKEKYGSLTVWVNCDIDELVRRDTKGLYKRSLLPDDDPAKIFNLTGINDTYEPPGTADLIIDTHSEAPEQSAGKLCELIISNAKTLS